MEKMLITQALDERDFLNIKIRKKINQLHICTVMRNKDKTTKFGNTPEEFVNQGHEELQSITDLIIRYNKINAAIALSNATTKIKVGNKEMTMAEAIGLFTMFRKGQDTLSEDLLMMLKKQQEAMEYEYNRLSMTADNERSNYSQSMLENNSNKKLSQEQIDAIDAMVDPIEPYRVQAVDIDEHIKQLQESVDTLKSELGTAIKISNATTFIEI